MKKINVIRYVKLSQLLLLLKAVKIWCVTVSLAFYILLLREYYSIMVKNPSPVSDTPVGLGPLCKHLL